MRRVIFNQKGGVGKSTITCNLAAISAAEGNKTLVIDLDIQGNSTQYLIGQKITDEDKTIAHFLKIVWAYHCLVVAKTDWMPLSMTHLMKTCMYCPVILNLKPCKVVLNHVTKSSNSKKRWKHWKDSTPSISTHLPF